MIARVARAARVGVSYLACNVLANIAVESQKLLTSKIVSLENWPKASHLLLFGQLPKAINNPQDD